MTTSRLPSRPITLSRVWGLCGGFAQTSPIRPNPAEDVTPQVPKNIAKPPIPGATLIARRSGFESLPRYHRCEPLGASCSGRFVRYRQVVGSTREVT